MSTCSDAMADMASTLCGSDFRLHGRDAETGLDCIGLTNLCLSAAGLAVDVPNGYSIRGGDEQTILKVMEESGFSNLKPHENLLDGDVVLVRPTPVQLHFMIYTNGGFVHAHAGLRKVVFSPGPSAWPVLHIFRLLES